MRRSTLLILLALTLVTAGCLSQKPENEDTSPTDQPPGPPDAAVVALTDCQCYEPNAVWTPGGTLLVTEVTGSAIARSTDLGHSFEVIDPPPLPEGVTNLGDAFLQLDPDGRIWWSSMAFQDPLVARPMVQVARSDDGGQTWAVNQAVSMSAGGEPTGLSEFSDRQWLAFGPDGTVYIVCNCPIATTQLSRSTDDGQTWSQPTQVPTPGRPGPAGLPAVTPDGSIVVPYLAGVAPGGVRAAGVAVSVSEDGGETWSVHEVWLGPDQGGTICCAFPSSALTLDGTVHVGWLAADGRALVAHSLDGGATWQTTDGWSGEGPAGTYPHVWLVPLNETAVFATWYASQDGSGATVETAWGSPGRVDGRATLAKGQPAADHPHAAIGPGGLLAVPFVDNDGHVAVHVLPPPGAAPPT